MTAPAAIAPLGLTKDEGHVYTWNDGVQAPIVLPSVTTAAGVLVKYGLDGWQAYEAAHWLASNLETTVRMVGDLGAVETAKAAKGRAETIRKAAANLGTRVHNLVEARVRGDLVVLDDETAPFVRQLDAWLDRTGPRILAAEEMIANLAAGYAGTFDLVVQLDGRTVLVDVKTGKTVTADMALQLAAYGRAEFIGRPGTAGRYVMPAIEDYAILHLRPEGARLVYFDVGEAEWTAFAAALTLYRWTRSGQRSVMRRTAE